MVTAIVIILAAIALIAMNRKNPIFIGLGIVGLLIGLIGLGFELL